MIAIHRAAELGFQSWLNQEISCSARNGSDGDMHVCKLGHRNVGSRKRGAGYGLNDIDAILIAIPNVHKDWPGGEDWPVLPSLIPASLAEEEVNSMANSVQVRNRTLEVTGALIYAGARFAQLLEGPSRSVNQIMASVEQDQRHEQINHIPVRKRRVRRFATWGMAYAGPSLHVDRHLKRHFLYLRDEEQEDGAKSLSS